MAQSPITTDVQNQLDSSVGRHLEKIWDWDAFPASRGFPELSRAQMRYVGSGGSPKVGDPSSLIPNNFTCSLLHQEARHYAAVHTHEIEEIFLVHEGRLTVSWEFGDEMVDVVLGPGDALVNPPERAHGFRNDGPGPMTAQFMVGHPRPMLPNYKTHPSSGGTSPDYGRPLLSPSDPRLLEVGRYLARASAVSTRWEELSHGSRLAVQPYVMPLEQGGLVEPRRFSLEMIFLPAGARTLIYSHPHEIALMVWGGQIRAEFIGEDGTASTQLGPRDLLKVDAGQQFRISNPGAVTTQLAAVIGTSTPAANLWTGGGD